MGQGGDRGLYGGAEMGASLPAVALGPGRSAVVVTAGEHHTCALLVRCGGNGSGLMMIRQEQTWQHLDTTHQPQPHQHSDRHCCCVWVGASTDWRCLTPMSPSCSLPCLASLRCPSPCRLSI